MFSPFFFLVFTVFFPYFHRAFCIGSIMFRAVFSFHRFHFAISCSSLIIYTFVLVCVTDFQLTIIYTFCVVFAHSYRVIMHFVIKEKKINFLQKFFKEFSTEIFLCWQNRPFWNKFVIKSWKFFFFFFLWIQKSRFWLNLTCAFNVLNLTCACFVLCVQACACFVISIFLCLHVNGVRLALK